MARRLELSHFLFFLHLSLLLSALILSSYPDFIFLCLPAKEQENLNFSINSGAPHRSSFWFLSRHFLEGTMQSWHTQGAGLEYNENSTSQMVSSSITAKLHSSTFLRSVWPQLLNLRGCGFNESCAWPTCDSYSIRNTNTCSTQGPVHPSDVTAREVVVLPLSHLLCLPFPYSFFFNPSPQVQADLCC